MRLDARLTFASTGRAIRTETPGCEKEGLEVWSSGSFTSKECGIENYKWGGRESSSPRFRVEGYVRPGLLSLKKQVVAD